MQDKQNIAVFVDYDNIEIGVKSTLRREFDVSLPLEALKERGDVVAKFAYANWGRQEQATRQMAENAVQMVQRIPSFRGDKNGADINLALDALEMAFTHSHVNAFAIISGDSDFVPLLNKLKEFGKTVFVVGGKAFTSTILQQNCHEFISYESLLMVADQEDPSRAEREKIRPRDDRRSDRDKQQQQRSSNNKNNQEAASSSGDGQQSGGGQQQQPSQQQQQQQPRKERQPALDLNQSMPLVERALQVLERRGVQPQLGLLKSTMLQLDSAFNERAYGAHSFSEFVDRLKRADLVVVTGGGGRLLIERKGGAGKPLPQPEEALPLLRDVLENHRLEVEEGVLGDLLATWMQEEQNNFDQKTYGFQSFGEFLNYSQDKGVVRTQPDEDRGLLVYLGAEFYPPALPPKAELPPEEEEDDGPQPIVEGQPTIFEPNPPPPKPKKQASPRKRATKSSGGGDKPRRSPSPRKRKD
ncbi:MAG: NYN domain-containing protein [Acidobacteria bacterium]|nr:NYN domain-containing protein [Acidobacteriota bacterium]